MNDDNYISEGNTMTDTCRDTAMAFANAMRFLHKAAVDFQREKRDDALKAFESIELQVTKFAAPEDWHSIKELLEQAKKGTSAEAVNRIRQAEGIVVSEFLDDIKECFYFQLRK